MSKLNFKRIVNLRSFTLIALIFAVLFTVGCSKENDPYMAEEAPVAESLELKKGRALPPGTQSIAQIAIGEGFTELVGALSYVDSELKTGLVDLFLNGKDQYTVFAPTNKAFEDLYKALGVTGITKLDAELVLNVLLYHVTEGRRAANSVVPPVKDREIETLLEGATFSVSSEGMIKAVGNTAKIEKADISASNGIIHIIDAVILPIVP
jgi:uncharacterized surface protein with fasciclin (FAS1) repeats